MHQRKWKTFVKDHLLFLFSVLVVVPAMLLTILGFRSIASDRERFDYLLQRERELTLEALGKALEDRLSEIRGSLADLLEAYDNHESAPQQVPTSLIGSPTSPIPPGGLVVVTGSGRVFFPLIGVFTDSPFVQDDCEEELRIRVLRAERFADRVRAYETAIRKAKQPSQRACLVNALARIYFKSNNLTRAAHLYASILDSKDPKASCDAPLFQLIAGLQLFHCLESSGISSKGLGKLLQSYSVALSGKCFLPRSTAQFYIEEHERILDTFCSPESLQYAEMCRQYGVLRAKKEAVLQQVSFMEELSLTVRSLQPAWASATRLTQQTIKLETSGEVLLLTEKRTPTSAVVAAAALSEEVLLRIALRAIADRKTPLGPAHFSILASDGRSLFSSAPVSSLAGSIEKEMDVFPFWRLRAYHLTSDLAYRRSRLSRNGEISILALACISILVGLFATKRTIDSEIGIARMRGEFVSIVSHEFRSPLASIKLLAQRLESKRNVDARRSAYYLAFIGGEIQRLERLVNNVLGFSEISAKRKSYTFRAVCITDILRNLLDVFRIRAESLGFVMRVDLSDVPPCRLDADAVCQVTLNLLDNALRYSDERKVIDMRLAYDDEFVEVEVVNSGTGVAPERARQIEDLTTDLKQHGGATGTGLGLTIVRHVVRAHRGYLLVDSSSDSRCHFRVGFSRFIEASKDDERSEEYVSRACDDSSG